MIQHLSAKYKNRIDFGGVSAFFFQKNVFFDVPMVFSFLSCTKRQ